MDKIKEDEKMQADNIYEEKIFLKGTTGVLAVFTAGFLFALVYQIFPALNWFFLLMFLLFLGVTINFNRLVIRMTPRSIAVGYGIFKHTIIWENIEGCYLDEASTIRYGGWGIRIGRVKGKWILVYNVIRCPRVVLSLRGGRFREFVFSTKSPEQVIKVVKQQIGGIK